MRPAAIFIVCMSLWVTASSSWAQAKKQNKDFSVNEFTYKRLEQVQGLMEENKYDEALKLVLPLRTDKFLNEHEKALVWRTIAYIYSGQEKYDSALVAFQTCLDMDALPEGAQNTTLYNMGQVALAAEQYTKAIQIFEDWLTRVENPTPDAYYTLALAYTQQKKYKKAMSYVQTAVSKRERPPESWLQLKLALHYFLDQWPGMESTLEALLERFPKRSYWIQLSQVYQQRGKYKRAMAVLELAYIQDMTTDSQAENLSLMLMNDGIPYKAGKILEAELKKKEKPEFDDLRMLAQAWMKAKEIDRAVAPMERAAAASKDGQMYLQLADLHRARGQWGASANAIQKALRKGGLRDPGNAYLLLGTAQLNSKNLAPAKKSFIKARSYRNTRDLAANWLRIVEQEEGRIARQKEIDELNAELEKREREGGTKIQL